MALTPQPPFPRPREDTMRSGGWTQGASSPVIDEVIRLDDSKVNRSGDTVSGTLPGDKLKDGSLPPGKIADGSLPGAKLQDDSINGSKLRFTSQSGSSTVAPGTSGQIV